ncbi:H-NS family nucleoid-associated regulatory protein [Stenotrophomonas rhizophila]|nr:MULTISPECIES: H-NS family nucleoid-associated regulatory protein [Stenotrophomonas]
MDPTRFAGNESTLLRAATKEAFKRVISLLETSFSDFSPTQQQHIRQMVGQKTSLSAPGKLRAQSRPVPNEAPPRFWLPFSGETWSGRGRPPKAFLAWEGTVAHSDWKKHHPGERFPAFPG